MIFYHRVLNLPDETPSKNVIDNDAELDRWIKKYNLKKQQESTGGSKFKSAKDHNSTISFGRK